MFVISAKFLPLLKFTCGLTSMYNTEAARLVLLICYSSSSATTFAERELLEQSFASLLKGLHRAC